MPTLQATEAPPSPTYTSTVRGEREYPAPAVRVIAERRERSLLFPTLTASIAAHFIAIAWFGAGIPAPIQRPAPTPEAPVAPIEIETVLVAPEIQEQPAPTPEALEEPSPTTPSDAPAIDTPALPEIQAVAAVPSTVPVSFGVEVKGPVRVVNDAALASGGGANARRAQPVTLDAASEHNLLLPAITYPPRAKRQRLTGTVWVEFRTTSTGEISDVRIRESSGHRLLDDAATSNLLAGRWKGRPGYYVKGYEFTLQ